MTQLFEIGRVEDGSNRFIVRHIMVHEPAVKGEIICAKEG